MAYFYKENKELESKINDYFGKLSKYNDELFASKLSLILLGSLSRNEGTWIETKEGFKMLSDIEYFTVFPSEVKNIGDFAAFEKEAAREVFGESNSSLFHIDNSFIKRENLPIMERKLLTFDAKKMGKTIFGEDAVLLIPEIDIKNINLVDIKDILTHRVFSVLYYGLPLKQEGKLEEYKYSLAKNSLDLMTVLLVINGSLISGFINRLEEVKKLQTDEKIKNYFEYCLSIKLSSECEYEFSVEEMEDIFLYLVKKLSKEFKIPLKNIAVNLKFVLRRVLGIIKRAIKYRHIPSLCHLKNLIKTFEAKKALTKKQTKNNLVINGYPLD